MQESLNISWQVYIYAFLFVFVFPVLVTIGGEYLLTNAVSKKIAVSIVLLSCFLFTVVCIQPWSSRVNITTGLIQLKSAFYDKKILISDGDIIQFYESKMPKDYNLKNRTNGFALPGYKVGDFIMDSGEPVFVMISQPPYIFISKQNATKHYIFSVSDKILPLISTIID